MRAILSINIRGFHWNQVIWLCCIVSLSLLYLYLLPHPSSCRHSDNSCLRSLTADQVLRYLSLKHFQRAYQLVVWAHRPDSPGHCHTDTYGDQWHRHADRIAGTLGGEPRGHTNRGPVPSHILGLWWNPYAVFQNGSCD